MPKINVYLPDALADRVRAANLPVSRICQDALTAALGNLDRDQEGDLEDLPQSLDLDRPLNVFAVAFVAHAFESARLRGAAEVESVDLLRGMLSEPESLIMHVVERAGYAATAVRARIDRELGEPGEASATPPPLGPQARRVLTIAQEEAGRRASPMIHGAHVAVGLLADEEGVAGRLLRELGIDQVIQPVVLDALSEGMSYGRSTARAVPDPWTVSTLNELAARLQRIEEHLG